MIKNTPTLIVIAALIFSFEVTAAEQKLTAKQTAAKEQADQKAKNELDQFGFGPALFFIQYDKEVLKDSKDVSTRGDGTIASNGSEYAVNLGLELHYDFSFGRKIKCYSNCDDPKNWNTNSSHRISPFLGLFDLENGINGIAAGLIYGYSKGTTDGKNKRTLNVGLGWTLHKDQLVLASDVQEGQTPPGGLNVEDYTSREDVKGITLMISANFGF